MILKAESFWISLNIIWTKIDELKFGFSCNTNQKLNKAIKHLQEDEEAGREIQMQLLPDDKSTFNKYEFSRVRLPSTYLSGDFTDYNWQFWVQVDNDIINVIILKKIWLC